MVDLAIEYEAEHDISRLIESEFKAIKQRHLSIQYLPADWPSKEETTELTRRAAGLFIYADVVMRYIGSPHGLPTKSLQEVLNLSELHQDQNIFSRLDEMYALILNQIPGENVQCVFKIFTWLIFDTYPDNSLSICDKLFDFHPGLSITLLGSLKAVIKIPLDTDADQQLGFFHASFGDFLKDEARLKHLNLEKFHCDEQQAHFQLAKCWICLCTKYELSTLGDSKFSKTSLWIALMLYGHLCHL